jgi:myosin heavy subunit
VGYFTHDFLVKNKDPLSEYADALFRNANTDIVKAIWNHVGECNHTERGRQREAV